MSEVKLSFCQVWMGLVGVGWCLCVGGVGVDVWPWGRCVACWVLLVVACCSFTQFQTRIGLNEQGPADARKILAPRPQNPGRGNRSVSPRLVFQHGDSLPKSVSTGAVDRMIMLLSRGWPTISELHKKDLE